MSSASPREKVFWAECSREAEHAENFEYQAEKLVNGLGIHDDGEKSFSVNLNPPLCIAWRARCSSEMSACVSGYPKIHVQNLHLSLKVIYVVYNINICLSQDQYFFLSSGLHDHFLLLKENKLHILLKAGITVIAKSKMKALGFFFSPPSPHIFLL